LSDSSCGKEISYTIPGIVKLWDSPQLGWGLSDGVSSNRQKEREIAKRV